MALIKCPDCGKDVSDSAKNCIHCGCVLKEETIKCPECGTETPSSAEACGNCGYGFDKSTESNTNPVIVKEAKGALSKKLLTVSAIIFLVIALLTIILSFFESGVRTNDENEFTKTGYINSLGILGNLIQISGYLRYLLVAYLLAYFAVPKIRQKWAGFVFIMLNLLSAPMMYLEFYFVKNGCLFIFFVIPLIIIWFVAMVMSLVSALAKDEK